MANYYTPGVFVEEISKLPGSVAPVATAIPAFIGYTKLHLTNVNAIPEESTVGMPTKINSLLEFETIFGGPQQLKTGSTVTIAFSNNEISSISDLTLSNYTMYYGIQHYFANGGGPCYIVTVGDTTATNVTSTALNKGVDALELVDEPTLLCFPDAKSLTASSLGTVHVKALTHCEKMGDRFAVLDVKDTQVVATDQSNFRDNVGTSNLSYGAAYYPNVVTNIPFGDVTLDNTKVIFEEYDSSVFNGYSAVEVLTVLYDTTFDEGASPAADNNDGTYSNEPAWEGSHTILTMYSAFSITAPTNDEEHTTALTSLKSALTTLLGTNPISNIHQLTFAQVLEILAASDPVADFPTLTYGYDTADSTITNNRFTYPGTVTTNADRLAYLQTEFTKIGTEMFAAELQSAITTKAVSSGHGTFGPSSAIAGIYATTDRNRGVWKAPANVSLNAVSKPTFKISDTDQEGLNVDPVAGKSINAIRTFSGKGTLVWGARTLAGNDNEWRYVNVRRLFLFMEESIQKATEFVVFEPNDANTWTKVKVMIENFLTTLWKDGALAGASPEDAFYVNVGLNSTMTSQDILEGRLIVEIGAAAVRPAEFIILRFMHKLQES